jgi:hypothetical protein
MTDTLPDTTDLTTNALPSYAIHVSYLSHRKNKPFTYIPKLSHPQKTVLQYLRHLLPLLSPSFVPGPTSGKIIHKVFPDLDFFCPFRQHAPSLANARQEIYADIDQFPGENGAGFFNVLAFRGVFFGSPFAQSNRYRWFDTFDDWENFRTEGMEIAENHGDDGDEEKYYVKKSCYGQSQIERSTELLSTYWNQRLLWSKEFNTPRIPSITEVHKWLTKRVTTNQKNTTLFRNIGDLTALLICGDLIEAGILQMPTAHEWGELIHSLRMGAKSAMCMLGLTSKKASKSEVSKAFASLDIALRQELDEEEKVAMNYNVIMLEHTLCKIKRLTSRGIALEEIEQEI